MLISLIIPMYNVEKYIERCLNSIYNQQSVNKNDFEVIIVNDGSPDNSEEIARNFIVDKSNARIITQRNQGLGAARNTGIFNAKGDYIWFIDSDDWIKENALLTVLENIRHGEFDIMAISADHSYNDSISNLQTKGIDSKDVILKRQFAPCAPFYIFKLAFLRANKLKFMTGVYHEDNEFTPRALYLCKSYKATNCCLYTVYGNPNSITRSSNSKKSYDLVIVANSLLNFLDKFVDDETMKKAFHAQISLCINSALSNIQGFEDKEIEQFNHYLRNNSFLVESFKKSNVKKYNFEYWVFKFFNANYSLAYKTISFLK